MERIYFNIDQLGLDYGLPTEEHTGPFGSFKKAVWNGEATLKICKDIHNTAAGCGEEIGLCGSAPMWVMTAAVAAIHPESISFHPGGPAPRPSAASGNSHTPPPEISLKIHALDFGEYDPAGDCEFNVTREGKRVFIDFVADKPDKPQLYGGGHHSYNPDLLPLVKCPAVEPDDDVFISGAGSFNIIESIATAYFNKCRSIWVPALNPVNVGEFFCAVSYSDDVNVGDSYKQ